MKRLVIGAVVGGGIAAACGSSPPPKPAPPQVSDRCPDLTKSDEVAVFDFTKEYAISREAADKLRAAALAGLEIAILADRLDADLGIACAQITHDLGNKGDYRTSAEACGAAIKTVQESRAKLGPKAQTQLVVQAPVCLVDPSLVTKCASLCDSSVPADKVRAECIQAVGRCDGTCDGTCEPKGSSPCDGVCSGTCEGTIAGTCGGRCIGKCDGKKSNGSCLGVCIGACDRGAIKGECKGSCTGTCTLAKPGICSGICAGKCTVELADEKCSGEIKPPAVSTDCRARCDLAVINKTECSMPQIGYVVSGAKPADAEAMKSAIDKAFPALLKILAEVGAQGGKRVLTAQQIIEGVRTGLKDLARSGRNAAASEAQMKKCFDEPFKKAAATAAVAKMAIDQALGVRDEATKPLP